MTTTKTTTTRTATKAPAKKPAPSRAKTPRPTAKLVPAAAPASTNYEIGSLHRVAPADLLVGANVRRDVVLGEAFVASIQENGVLVPLLVYVGDGGALVVHDGQRRTLGALDANVESVPIVIVPVPSESDRIVEQLVVNSARAGISQGDEIEAVRQLAFDLRLPASQIVKRAGASKESVAAVKRFGAASAEHRELIANAAAASSREFDLEALALLAEHPELTADEIAGIAASPNRKFSLEKTLEARVVAARVAEIQAELSADNVALADRPSHGTYGVDKNKHRFLSDLVDKSTGKPVDAVEHRTCPGHAAWVGNSGWGRDLTSTKAHLLCTDPSRNGHRPSTSKPPLTDDERAAKKAAAARANDWATATTVRRAWIAEHLQQVAAAKHSPTIDIVLAIAASHSRGHYEHRRIMGKLLGSDSYVEPSAALTAALSGPTAGLRRLALADALAAIEISIDHAPELEPAMLRSRTAALVLGWLSMVGFQLSDVEQEIVDIVKAAEK